MSGKTEEATPKRLRRARDEGDSPQSTFATQSMAFLCAVAVAPAGVAALATHASVDLRAAIARAAEMSPVITVDAEAIARPVIVLVVPILLAAAAAAAVTSVVQTGGIVATKRLTPKLERLDPFAGFRQLITPARLSALARAGVFGGVVAWLAYSTLRAHAAELANASQSLSAASTVATALALEVVRLAAVVGVGLAVLDIVIMRRSWRKRLMMSKDEVRREHRESEGDPQLKAARERAHHEMLAAAAVANVRHASVVVVNPVHVACALRYDEGEGDEAPVILASGHGDLAARIVVAARQYGVPVLRDVPLARALVELEIGAAIPEALYEAVAEILREAWEDEK